MPRKKTVVPPAAAPTAAAGTATAMAPVTTSGGLAFKRVSMEVVPKFVPGGGAPERKYKALEEALRALPQGQALEIAIPLGTDGKLIPAGKFSANILSSLRRAVPETRSRATETTLYLWMGDPAEVAARRAKAAAAAAAAEKKGA